MTVETKYAQSGDIYIAYQVTGSAPVDVVLAPGTVSHLDLDWEIPAKAHLVERLSSFCRLIRFDKRGTGLSDRPLEMATLEERTDDIRAVMDAAGSRQATLFGVSEGGSMACLFAATYPERVRSLMLWGTQARWVRTDDYPWGQTPEEDERMIKDVQENWPSREYVLGWGAGFGKDVDPAILESILRYCRAAGSPSAVAAYERMNGQIDLRPILPTIRVPTLVMNRTGDPVTQVEAARDLAAHIPGARFIEFPGATHQITIEPEPVLAEIEEFVTGARSPESADRILATVLFIDIVGSTERAARLGDVAWRELLESFYTAERKEFARFRGGEVDNPGDGFLVTFDGPARAIRCALASMEAVKPLGLELRAGLHTGECELMVNNKVGGIAVHICARVMAKAGPGEVLVSSTVKDLVAGSGIQFEARGSHTLKGVPGKWQLYAARQ